jgi:hypothetical protein
MMWKMIFRRGGAWLVERALKSYAAGGNQPTNQLESIATNYVSPATH